MNPTLPILTTLLLAPQAVVHAADAPGPSRPNILYIMSR